MPGDMAILRYAPCFPKGRGRYRCEGVSNKNSGSAEDIFSLIEK